jgi:tRNA uridine 5-carboxymethylaminomethyl modification enzyme
MSTSLPAEVQLAFLRTLPGLEACHMIRPGYAVEYDFVPPTELTPALMTKRVAGCSWRTDQRDLGLRGGRGPGPDGRRERRAPGSNRAPWTLGRADAYIGVMLDDLVTKGVSDPYRLLTSRAEFRLTLRQDNADLRLTGSDAIWAWSGTTSGRSSRRARRGSRRSRTG